MKPLKTHFYRRSGERISRAVVKRARLALADAKATGKRQDGLPCSIQPTVAAKLRELTEEAFCDLTGVYTWKKVE